jgi:hypothetical protein
MRFKVCHMGRRIHACHIVLAQTFKAAVQGLKALRFKVSKGSCSEGSAVPWQIYASKATMFT